jgi:hypothetical protein
MKIVKWKKYDSLYDVEKGVISSKASRSQSRNIECIAVALFSILLARVLRGAIIEKHPLSLLKLI